MKTGKTLVELAAEITRRAESKVDFIAPVGKLEMVVDGDAQPMLAVGAQGAYRVNQNAHDQLAAYAGIPAKYYKRMQAADPDLLAKNVNRWLHDEASKDDKRMIRTLDGKVRAVVSDSYRKIENEDIAEAVLPALMARDMIIMSADITETRMYLKAVDRSIEKNIPKGFSMGDGSHQIFDCLSPAVIIGNSETGNGSYFVETGVFTKACTNLALFGASMRRTHLGARAEHSEEVYALLTQKTHRISDAALMSQLQDIIKGTLTGEQFDKTVEALQRSSEDKIDADVVKVVEQFGRKFDVTEGEQKGILQRLIEGADLSRYGLHSAVTRFSADVENYDRATELERLGGDVVTLAQSDWKQLLKMAA